jgi:hypothetical protein
MADSPHPTMPQIEKARAALAELRALKTSELGSGELLSWLSRIELVNQDLITLIDMGVLEVRP